MSNKKPFPRALLWGLVILGSVLVDQGTKKLVTATMALYEIIPVIPGLFSFCYIENSGAAWGIFSNHRWIFLAVTALAIIGLPTLLYRYRNLPFLFGFSLSLVLGGAIGNMIDRIFHGNVLFDGAVVDFISADFIDFPIFNVADCFVTVGAVLMFIYLIFIDKEFFREDKKEKKAETPEEGPHENDCDRVG